MTATKNKAQFKPNAKKLELAQNAIILSKGNVAAASRSCGVTEKTISSYIKAGYIDPSLRLDGEDNYEALTELAADHNAKLAEVMLDTAGKAVEHVNANLHTASAKDAAIIAGVMVDKSRLLEGKATQRVEIDVSHSLEVLERHGLLIQEDVIEGEIVD